MTKSLIKSLKESRKLGNKHLGVLIDPDKIEFDRIPVLAGKFKEAGISYILVGGSLLTTNRFNEVVVLVKKYSNIPLILFPSTAYQISDEADAILFLSLISGRNADLLIGKHVEAAPILYDSNLEIIPTGYMLIDGGSPTTASYMSNTQPIPSNKPEIASCTAVAGQMLGLQAIYLDAGSGAKNPVPQIMIQEVGKAIKVPLIVGGGIKTPELAYNAAVSGADLVVIGNVLETSPELLWSFSDALKEAQTNVKNASPHV